MADLYRRACEGSPCENGDPLGCFNLGVFYRDGKGVAMDKTQAAALFERSCAGHNAFGCANLADLLYAGDGVPKDEKRALDLFRQACAGGHALSCRNAQALEAENRQLVASGRVKSLFLSNMSHELYTPLNAIAGYAHLLATGTAPPGSPRFERYLDGRERNLLATGSVD